MIWFVDNEAAVSTLIRGAAKPEDLDRVAACASVSLLQLSCRVWWEWIDSKSNPSDGLSRKGLADEWTIAQGWKLVELGDRDWSDILTWSDPASLFEGSY